MGDHRVSHSAGWSALAVSVAPMGLDIERIACLPALDDVAAFAFGPLERKALADRAPSDREEFFYGCWTRKEALLKGMGCGFSLAPGLADTFQNPEWHFHEVTGIAGCAGFVATKLAGARVVVRSVPSARSRRDDV